jgi:DNA-binding NarL/FixJ family response regulator
MGFGAESVSHVRLLVRMTPKPPAPQPLTPREREISRAILAAESNRAIAERLGISEQSVKNRLTKLYRKLGISSRLELMQFLIRQDGHGKP